MDSLVSKQLARLYQQDRVPLLAAKRSKSPGIPLSVARVSQTRTLKDAFSTAGPNQDVTFIAVPLIDEPAQSIFEQGREIRLAGRRKGALYTYNLQAAPQRDLSVPFDSVTILLPQSTLNSVDIFEGRQNARALRLPAFGALDPTVEHLVASLLPALENPEAASRLYVDHVLNALQIHMLIQYGGSRREPRKNTGQLAGWQLQRAKELMAAHVSEEISLEALANACQLSPSHFSRAFKNTAGVSPHTWLTTQRMERAKALLAGTDLTLDSIALECGFAHRVSFSRTFQRFTGTSPASWRRLHRALSHGRSKP